MSGTQRGSDDVGRDPAGGQGAADRDAGVQGAAYRDAGAQGAADRDAGVQDADAIARRIAELVDGARPQLAGVAPERLGITRPARRLLGVTRAERIVPGGDVWHLGALLVRCEGPAEDALLATGEILRAREEVRRGFTAESQRARAARAAAARRGGFAEGETAHVDAVPIAAGVLAAAGACGPVSVGPDGTLLIRWSRTASAVPLQPYLAERIDLLEHPAPGA